MSNSFLPEGYKLPSTPIYKPRVVGGSKSIDISNHLFRCSHLDKLSTKRKEYSAFLLDLYHQVVNGYEQVIETEAMTYGIEHEQEAIDLVNSIRGTNYVKADLPKSNDYITTQSCDILLDDCVIDIKCPKETTFKSMTYNKALRTYKKQLTGYCWLFGKTYAEILFCSLETRKIKKFAFEVTPQDIQELENEIRKYRMYWSKWQSLGITSKDEIPFM
jgi:hypothetical protein